MINNKKSISCAVLAAAGVLTSLTGEVEAQSAPAPVVGVNTVSLNQGFNYLGLTLHKEVVLSGTLDAVASNDGGTAEDTSDDTSTLTESDATLTTTLGVSGSATYILEITSGSLAGTIQEVSSWTANTFDTPNDLAADGLVAGTTYNLRKACTIADVFGATNQAGLKGSADFNVNEADLIYIPDGETGFNRFYYSTSSAFTGWVQFGVGPANNEPIIYADAIFVQKRDAGTLTFPVSGSVKATSTCIALPGSGSFTYVGSVYPEGSTLGNSGLSAQLTPSDDFNINEADVVYLSDGGTGFNRFYYSTSTAFTGWVQFGVGPADSEPLTSGMVILRRGAGVNAKLTPAPIITNN